MLQIAICDDDLDDCNLIFNYINTIMEGCSESYEIYKFHGGKEFLVAITSGAVYDIAFLDYEMEEINGLRLGMELRSNENRQSLLIYVSSHSEMIFQLLDTYIFNFIEKPISYEKFEEVFLKAYRKVTDNNVRIRISINRNDYFIEKQEIILVESLWRQLKIHTTGQEYMIYGKLDEFEKETVSPFHNFIRVQKSFLLNFDYASDVGRQYVKLNDGIEIKISDAYLKRFQEDYHTYLRRRRG